jgi:hypothetical protein
VNLHPRVTPNGRSSTGLHREAADIIDAFLAANAR